MLTAAINKKPQFLNGRLIFDIAMNCRQYDLAEKALDIENFFYTIRWEMPIYDAVAHHHAYYSN